MKKLFVIILLNTLSMGAKAQILGGFFNQGSTQKKYLLQQIAALQVYIGYAQKGYSIAKQGLNTISNIKHGEFNLHTNYYNSLKTVNPSIKGYAKVTAIIALQVRIVKVYKNASGQIQQSGAFTSNETTYLNGVFARLMDDCNKTIDELIDVVTSNKLEMKDDERLKRIDDLYADMQGKYTFVQAFSNEAKMLGVSRTREQNDIETRRAINGIKK